MDHSMIKAIEDPELGLIEVGFMIGKHPIDARTFAVHVPKVMPLMGGMSSSPSTGSMPIDKSIFLSNNEAGPSPSSKVSTKNHINVTLYPNRSTSNSSNRDVLHSTIGPGNKMMIHFVDHNVYTRHLDEVL